MSENYRSGIMHLNQSANSYREISFDEAVEHLNQVTHPTNPEFTYYFAYHKYLDKWFLITNNPLPRYVSHKAIIHDNLTLSSHDVAATKVDHFKDFTALATNLYFTWLEKDHFYVPSTLGYRENIEQVVTVSLAQCVIYEVESSYIDGFKREPRERLRHLTRAVLDANRLAYFTSVYWNDEIRNFASEQGSFYTEFAKVKNVKEYAKLYRQTVFEDLTELVKKKNHKAQELVVRHFLPKEI